MAVIKSVDLYDEEVVAHLKLSKKEYNQLAQNTEELLLLPINSLPIILTTGKLGNGNRIMFPTRLLKQHNMKVLPKNVPADIFYLEEDKYLLIKLEGSKPGIPIFPESWQWKR